jgi:hypothetical protein
VNDPLAFISFIAEHRLGEQLEAEVEGYTSHGAVVRVGDMRCYVPLANLADPPPRSAREVLKRHERAIFVLTALDPQRRGAELALPGIALVSGHPREETVAAEVRLAKPPRQRAGASGSRRAELGEPPVPTAATPPPGRRPRRGVAGTVVAEEPATAPAKDAAKLPAKKAPAKRAPAKKAASLKQGARRERPAPAADPAASEAAAEASPTKAPRKSAAAKRTAEPVRAAPKRPGTAEKPAATKSSGRAPKAAAKRSAPAPAGEVATRSSKAAAEKSPSARKSPRAVKSAAASVKWSR